MIMIGWWFHNKQASKHGIHGVMGWGVLYTGCLFGVDGKGCLDYAFMHVCFLLSIQKVGVGSILRESTRASHGL
jgi:hypothetical protein